LNGLTAKILINDDEKMHHNVDGAVITVSCHYQCSRPEFFDGFNLFQFLKFFLMVDGCQAPTLETHQPSYTTSCRKALPEGCHNLHPHAFCWSKVVIGLPQVFFFHHLWTRTFGITGTGGSNAFLSPTQQCQSTEGHPKH